MNGYRQSDSGIVPEKFSNKVLRSTAEGMEGRPLVKGNELQNSMRRTQSRGSMQEHLECIRQFDRRHNLWQEPDARNTPVRICVGGSP